MSFQDFSRSLSSFPSVSLNDLENVRLMNRTDTKYVMPLTRVESLLESLRDTHRVLEINGIRSLSYSTTYLDTDDFLFFTQHVTGREERNKVRFRSYLSTGESFLEIKMRNRKGRTIKRRIEIPIENKNQVDEKARDFLGEHIPGNLVLRPVLTSKFNRITLTGIDCPERITIDFGISFESTNEMKASLPHIAVVELKRDTSKGLSVAADALKALNVRQLGFSKYCIGASLLYELPHRNSVKPKLLLLNKIENEHNRDLRA